MESFREYVKIALIVGAANAPQMISFLWQACSHLSGQIVTHSAL